MLRLLVLSAVIAPCILSSITKDQLKDFLRLHRRNYNAKKDEDIPAQVYCPPGARGAGGVCICEDAIGHDDGEWRRPTCYEGACYNNQAYELCLGQENGHAFGDGTWCWNQLRSTQCPTSNGVICPAGTRSAGGACNCTAAVGYVEGEWRTPWCYEGSCYTGQASEQCIGAENGHPLGDGTWCWGQERNTRCPTASDLSDKESDETEPDLESDEKEDLESDETEVDRMGNEERVQKRSQTDQYAYSSLGCWYDHNHDTGIPRIDSWREETDAIDRCFQYAVANGFPAFAVQDRGTCRTGPNIMDQYDTMGPATNCANGRGGAWANDVYLISTYSNLGCWNDQGHNTGIPFIARWQSETDTINKCFSHAAANGYPAFAVQAGGTCRTGPNILEQFYTMGQATNCANGKGGGWANEVYGIDCDCTGEDLSYSSLGCWYDHNHDTGIPRIDSWREEADAIDRCFQYAVANGFPAFAVQDRGTCRTGPNIMDQYDTMGPATNCANGRGGAWANDVYRIGCKCTSR